MRKSTLFLLSLSMFIFNAGSSLFAQSKGFKVITSEGEKHELDLYKNSYAFIIGMSEYNNGWQRLLDVKNEMVYLDSILKGQGFSTIKLIDLTSKQLLDSLNSFLADYGLESDNRLLFYFSCHGYTYKLSDEDYMGYLIPVDSPIPSKDEKGFISTAIPMNYILSYAENIRSKHVLFLFDACFSGSIFYQKKGPTELISYKTTYPVRQFITAGSADEEVPAKSIFLEQFINGISGQADLNGDGYVTGSEAGMFIQDNVILYSNGSQHPQYGKIRNSKLDKGDFVFIPDNKLRFPINVNIQKPQKSDLTFDISVMNDPASEKGNGNLLNSEEDKEIKLQATKYKINYIMNEKDGRIIMYPRVPYKDLISQGGPINDIEKYNYLSLPLPSLDLKFINNTNELVYITKVILEIDSSWIDTSPYIGFYNDYGNWFSFILSNQGWGKILNPIVRFNVKPLNINFSYEDKFKNVISLDSVSTGRINLIDIVLRKNNLKEEMLSEIIGDLNIYNSYLFTDTSYYDRKRVEEQFNSDRQKILKNVTKIREYLSFDIFDDKDKNSIKRDNGFARLYGVMEYKTINKEFSNVNHYLKFNIEYPLVYGDYGDGQLPSYEYQTFLSTEGSHYKIIVPTSQIIKPKETDRFLITLYANKSSFHKFRVKLVYNDGQEIFSKPIELEYFLPAGLEDEDFNKPYKDRKHRN